MNDITDSIEFITLNFEAEEESLLSEEQRLRKQKFIDNLISCARKGAKPSKCYCCGREISGFCNSHSTPAFCLRNISSDGKLFCSNRIIGIPFQETTGGINKSGTFRLLCRDCDSKIFRDYENPNNYNSIPTPSMLAQIAMKNYLKHISKRRVEIALYLEARKYQPDMAEVYNHDIDGKYLDLNEYIKDFQRAKSANKHNASDAYKIIFYKKLNYVVPFAIQSAIVITYDFNGEILNNIYCSSKHLHLKEIQICVFPLEYSSVVIMFVDANIKKYNDFIKQFYKFSEVDQLAIINYIIFLYSEDFYLSPKVSDEIIKNKEFKNIVGQLTTAISDEYSTTSTIVAGKSKFDLNKWSSIPNLLSEEYRLE